MINLVKVFTFVVIATSVVIISVHYCEATKTTDFSLKNIIRIFNQTIGKKFKKDIKATNINQMDMNELRDRTARLPMIHTLMPLPLPVHLPIPSASEINNHIMVAPPLMRPPLMPPLSPGLPTLINLARLPTPPLYPHPNIPPHSPPRQHSKDKKRHKSSKLKDKQDHYHDNQDNHHHHDHDHYHDHNHDHYNDHDFYHYHHHPHSHAHKPLDPLSPMASNLFIRPMPPPIIIHQQYNPVDQPMHMPPMPLPPVHSEPVPNALAVPVFELIEANPKDNEVHPNAHSYGRETDDTIKTNVNSDSNSRPKQKKENDVTSGQNRDRERDKERQRHANEQQWSQPEKSTQTPRSVKLVNSQKFNTIHNFMDEETNRLNRFEEKSHKRANDMYSDHRPDSSSRQYSKQQHSKPTDHRVDQKLAQESGVAVPDEQSVNVVEDEWTFKDLDLWLIR